ncbi:molybdopterin-guanine dinucleotide biosynthesis protein B [Alkalihalobacillus sp. CinArs1]|uniref:molybdopterin-guanine dinucleotide biosynthesis protein B n=1 Tax=Alkalihalobacillus sp. CinArs1 TaxID=2995314 RepID=UPI0022DE7FC1|nr:molybdopterin-guanine dinucleotide biosynthesis protein B [Alkalihalobacillus sp. CinArs1]
MSAAILQVVGYQNSGKTLFIETFIKEAKNRGLKIGVIKHHGHGKPDVYDRKKDTGRHRHAGAVVTGVSGDGLLSINAMNEKEWELEKIISVYSSFELDLIMIEGYKRHHFPRVVMLRDHRDDGLLVGSMIKAIVTQGSQLPNTQSYHVQDINKCIDHLLEELQNGVL